MKRAVLVALVVASAFAATARAQGVDLQAPSISAEEVDAAIKLKVQALYSMMNEHGHWELLANYGEIEKIADEQVRTRRKWEWCGRTALAVLALLYADEDPQSDKLARAINFLAENETDGTYATGIRAGVWSKLSQKLSKVKGKEFSKYRHLLKRDAEWLMECTKRPGGEISGYFGYVQHTGGDHSNSQYGVLGLREAALRYIEIPIEYWEIIQKHYIETQGENGGWGYRVSGVPPDVDTYGSMTVAGLASMYITFDMLTAASYQGRSVRCCGRRKIPEAIEKGKAWLDRNLPADFGVQGAGPGDLQTFRRHGMNMYYIYGLERCASASGRKTFGGLNWFETGAKYIIAHQQPDGRSGDSCNTSWALLFLCKGRGTVFYNKLDTGADWNNNPQDIFNVSRFCTDELEQRINWQVVDIKDDVRTWLDAPVLFFNGYKLPKFSDEQKQKLRLYTDSGGTLVAEACCSKQEFVAAFQKLAQQVWPEWELQAVTDKHPVMTSHYKIEERLPRMFHIHDGCRSRVFLITQDMACAWGRNLTKKYKPFFEFGMNLPRYASDNRKLQSRLYFREWELDELTSQGKALPERSGVQTKLVLADWPTDGRRRTDIRALRHLKETMDEGHNVALETVALNDHLLDGLDKVQVLHMSGHHTFTVSDENIAKLREFVKRGGLIWADAHCGRKAFNESFPKFLEKLFPEAELTDLPKDDAVKTGKGLPREGFDVTTIRYKRKLKFNEFRPLLKEVRRGGRRVIIYSPYDLTCGLDGHFCWGCVGPERNHCLRMAANILLSVLPPDAAADAQDKERPDT